MTFFRLLALLCLVAATPAHALPGDLDPTFGIGGVSLTDLGPGNDSANSVGLQPSGRLIAGGYVGSTLTRFLPDGTLDPSFGTLGVVRHVAEGLPVSANALHISADGGIVATGRIDLELGFATVSSVLPDGTPDPDFGTDGVAVPDLGAYGQGTAIVRLSDGRILFTVSDYVEGDVLIVRLSSTGVLDPTFGVGGIARFPRLRSYYGKIAVLSDGRLLVLGGTGDTPSAFGFQITVIRLDPNGALDTSFGDDGFATVFTERWNFFRTIGVTMLVQPDGRIVVGGSATQQYPVEKGVPFLTRLLADGTLDASFGNGGRTYVDGLEGWTGFSQLVRQPDGRLFAVGHNGLEPSQVMVGRFNEDGTIDPTFGVDGLVGTSPSAGSPVWGYAFGAVLQGDGRLVTAGTRTDPVNDDLIMLARYETACPPLGECTPCTSARYLGAVKLKAGRLRLPAADETMTLTARGTLPQSADLAATGVRIVLEEPDADVLLDATVPGGVFSAATKSGWKGAAGKFIYRNAGTVAPRPGGVAKIASKVDARGRLTLKLQIKDGSLPITEASLPLQAWIALDPPAGASGACVVTPAATSCALDATGNTLRCE